MAGWLHGVFVGEWLFVFSLCGFSLSLFCNYTGRHLREGRKLGIVFVNTLNHGKAVTASPESDQNRPRKTHGARLR